MAKRLKGIAGSIALVGGLVLSGGAVTASAAPDQAAVCPAPPSGYAKCGAVQLLNPAQNWHPGARSGAASISSGGASATVAPPTSGFYPADLQSAYGLASAESTAAATGPGASAPTIAVVDAYDDPNAAADLSTYRSSLSGVTHSATGLTDGTIPPLCSSTVTTGCVTFSKVNQSGGTSYPRGDTGWAEEISLDLDMASAICPDCNIELVEATSNSFGNLQTAVAYAKSLTPAPAAVTNSYGGGEFSSETSYNSTYSNGASTAITASTGDSGYGVEFPAAAPNVTAVGGTSLNYSGSGTGISWSQTVWSGAGAGCSAYESEQSWQQKKIQPSQCSNRTVGDIAAIADPNTGVAVYDTYQEPGWMVFGGTSASAQIIGAMYGLAAFGTATVQPSSGALYSTASGNLVPVTSGSDGNCGTYLCNAADSVSGYNGPTGLGTPNGVGAFTGAPAAAGFTVSASPSSTSVVAGNPVSYSITVAPNGGFTGTVSLSATGCPADVSPCTPNPASVNITSTTAASSTLSFTSNNTGNYSITITGTSGSVTSSTTVQLAVTSTSTTGTMAVTITPGTETQKGPNYKVPLTVAATDAISNSPISGASVTLSVYSGGCPASGTPSGSAAATGTGTTGANGQVTFNFSTRTHSTWCAVATVTDTGYTTGTGSKTFTS